MEEESVDHAEAWNQGGRQWQVGLIDGTLQVERLCMIAMKLLNVLDLCMRAVVGHVDFMLFELWKGSSLSRQVADTPWRSRVA